MRVSLKFPALSEKAALVAAVTMAASLVVFPYLWMVLTSFKPLEEFFTYPLRWLPSQWTTTHYVAVLDDPRFLRALWNSFVVSAVVTVVSLALTLPAAFALARLALPGARRLLIGILSAQFLPPMIFFVPFYIYLSRLHLMNTLTGLVVAYLAITLPICAWMVASFIQQIPIEYDEAARIDGCSDLQVISHVVLPLAAPGIVTAGLYVFIHAWQEYIFALLYTSTPAAQTAPVLLFYFLGQHQIDYGRLMSSAVLLSLPIMVPFAFLQRYFQQGLTSGGIKG